MVGATKVPRRRWSGVEAVTRQPRSPHRDARGARCRRAWACRRSPGRRRWRAGRVSDAQLAQRAVEHRECRSRRRPAAKGAAPSSAAGAVEGRRDDVVTACSVSAVLSTIMAFWPPVSATSGTAAAPLAVESRAEQLQHLGRAGEDHAVDARVGDQGAPPVSPAWSTPSASRARRLVGATACGGDERRLLGWLGEHGVARSGDAAADLASEDGEREVPGLMQTTGPSGPWVGCRTRAGPRRRSSGRKSTASRTSATALGRSCRPRAPGEAQPQRVGFERGRRRLRQAARAGWRRRRPARCRGVRQRRARSASSRVASGHGPTVVAWSAGLSTGATPGASSAAGHHRRSVLSRSSLGRPNQPSAGRPRRQIQAAR